MTIQIKNTSDEPIYIQIKYQIKNKILLGEIVEGDKLPSIRQLAQNLGVSTMTIRRTYDELEQEECIKSIPGKGSFVSPPDKEKLKQEYLNELETRLSQALDVAEEAGVSRTELCEIFARLAVTRNLNCENQYLS